MTVEPLIGGTTVAVVALVGWVWRLSSTVTAHSVQLGICLPHDDKIERLEKGQVRSDTTLEHLSGQMAELKVQLQPLPAIAEGVRNISAELAELKAQVVTRETLDARFKPIESKLP